MGFILVYGTQKWLHGFQKKGVTMESKKSKGIKELLSEYGGVAMTVYFAIFFICLVFFYLAIQSGTDLSQFEWFSGTLGQAGTLGIAYAATKVIQPIRIGLTVLLTPVVAKWSHRRKAVSEVHLVENK